MLTNTVNLEGLNTIKPNTPEMEQHLAAGYPDIGTVAKAKMIIKERAENPALWPYEMKERAEAFLAAYTAVPRAISTKPGVRDE